LKHKIIAALLMLAIVISMTGCVKKTSKTNVELEVVNTHKIIIVVVDKETSAPVKAAKVYILGDNVTYTTDDMGKTSELNVELNKDYFTKYSEEIVSRMRSGFVNVAVKANGYANHLETDYSVYPGDSISIVRVELSKGKNYTVNSNSPDISYIENLMKTYEKYESQEIKSDNIVKYKISVVDEKNKPIEGAKVVIPEAKAVNTTDKKGKCELNIPFIEASNVAYPVNKGYGEITVLTYKEGYLSKAVIRAHISTNEKTNTIAIKIKKSSKSSVECEVVKPTEEWVKAVLDSIKE
jgi:hypothetical protein